MHLVEYTTRRLENKDYKRVRKPNEQTNQDERKLNLFPYFCFAEITSSSSWWQIHLVNINKSQIISCDEVIISEDKNGRYAMKLLSSENVDISSLLLLLCSK